MSGYEWKIDAVSTMMKGLVDDVAAALAAGPTGAIARVVAGPGSAIAWDGNCGQLTLAHTRTFRTRNFPQDASGTYTKCVDTKSVFDLTMQVVRCVDGLSDNGVSPSPAAVEADLVVIERDAFIVWTTVDCALSQLQTTNLITDYIVNDQVPLGEQGGLAGTELHFQVGLFTPSPCDQPCGP